jgi:hypothetical protein
VTQGVGPAFKPQHCKKKKVEGYGEGMSDTDNSNHGGAVRASNCWKVSDLALHSSRKNLQVATASLAERWLFSFSLTFPLHFCHSKVYCLLFFGKFPMLHNCHHYLSPEHSIMLKRSLALITSHPQLSLPPDPSNCCVSPFSVAMTKSLRLGTLER